MAALEYPIGPIDVVSEFLVFHVVGGEKKETAALKTALERDVGGIAVKLAQEGAMGFVGADNEKWLAKILLRPNVKWQIWPTHGAAPFSRSAPLVLKAAECIHAEVGGEIVYRGRAFDEALRGEVASRIDGLGVELFLWTQSSATPQRRRGPMGSSSQME
jgi:hypothetical protein